MRVTKGGALDTPCHWGGARVEALVAIRLAGGGSKREKRPPKTFSKNVYSILKMFCFLNHLFYDWLCVDLTSAFSTCSCQRVICKPFCNVKVKVFEVEFIVVCCNHI